MRPQREKGNWLRQPGAIGGRPEKQLWIEQFSRSSSDASEEPTSGKVVRPERA
jgi:hypothetical protein